MSAAVPSRPPAGAVRPPQPHHPEGARVPGQPRPVVHRG